VSFENQSISKRDSVWHNFCGNALAVMRVERRAQHPSRDFVDRLMHRWFTDRSFEWLEVGVVGMVDYSHLRPTLNFQFTGADLSESIAKDSCRYIQRPEDGIIVWDIEDPPDAALHARYNIVTLRHVLNHCEYYKKPLDHVAAVLRPGGWVVIVLHLCLVTGPDRFHRHRDWSVPGEVIGNHYNQEKFLDYFALHFKPELWVRVDDGKKPNDIIIGRNRSKGHNAPSGVQRLRMHRLWSARGRRNAPRRVLSRLCFWLRTPLPR